VSKFEVGDKVWSPQWGWGKVGTTTGPVFYPVGVVFTNGARVEYTEDGKLYNTDTLPTLFHNEVKPEDWPNPAKPEPKLVEGEPMIVIDSPKKECRRYCAGYDADGRILYYGDGRDCWSAVGVAPKLQAEDWRRLTAKEMAEYRKLKGLDK